MRKWALDQLTVIGATPAEYVEIAAYAGYDAVSPLVGTEDNGPIPIVPLRADDPKTAGFVKALKNTDLELNEADGFLITPEFNRAETRQGLEFIATLGASKAGTLIYDDENNRMLENLAWLCDEAHDIGLGVSVEFTVLSLLPSLRASLDLISIIGSDKLGVCVDLLHLAQTDETPDDIRAAPEGVITGAQLCDAPANLDMEKYSHVAMNERMSPGDGELPVEAFLAAVPESVMVGIEVPNENAGDLGQYAKTLLQRAKSFDVD